MQTTNQKGIVKLTKAQYNTLVTTGSVTDGAGNTFTYQDGYLYVTDDVEYVSFTEAQVLTPQQQAQARANIGAGGASATLIKINGVDQVLVTFDSDPQTQINGKVPNTRTIAGVDLQDNITQNELLTALNVENGAEVNEVNDIEIDDVSCVTGTTAEIRTINGDYNASTNRLATGSDLSSLVDKTNVANQVYGTDNNGDQTTYDVANASNVGGAIAQYDSSGRLKSATPDQNDDVANKNYVDGVISNPNLLINGDFKINQRGANSYSTTGKYTCDRWKLVSGTVAITSSGITLNGTITQTLENEPSGTVTASASAGEASYSGGVFTLTASNQNISWAKLEVGSIATPFSPRSTAEELALCQRYYQVPIESGANMVTCGFLTTGGLAYYMQIPLTTPLRTSPTLVTTPKYRAKTSTGNSVHTGSSFVDFTSKNVYAYGGGTTVTIYDTIAVMAETTNNIVLTYEVQNVAFDAEIY